MRTGTERRRLWLRCSAAAVAGMLGISGVSAQQATELQWPGSYTYSWASSAQSKKRVTFDITPYLWASGINGDVGVGERTAHVDISFREILDNLKGAFMMPAELWYGRLGVGAELIWTRVGDGKATPGPLFDKAELDVKQFIGDISPRFRIIGTDGHRLSRAGRAANNGNDGNGKNGGGKFTLDALIGIRYWSLKNNLKLTEGTLPELEIDLDRSWGDPYVGARAFYFISDRWGLQVRGDVGGFDVGSKFAWQALGMVSYRVGSWGTLRAGYRQLDVDYDPEPGTGFLYDVGIGGVILGLTLGT